MIHSKRKRILSSTQLVFVYTERNPRRKRIYFWFLFTVRCEHQNPFPKIRHFREHFRQAWMEFKDSVSFQSTYWTEDNWSGHQEGLALVLGQTDVYEDPFPADGFWWCLCTDASDGTFHHRVSSNPGESLELCSSQTVSTKPTTQRTCTDRVNQFWFHMAIFCIQ